MWQIRAGINRTALLFSLALLGAFVLLALVPPAPVSAHSCANPDPLQPWNPPLLCQSANAPNCSNCYVVRWAYTINNIQSNAVRYRFAPHGNWTTSSGSYKGQFVIPGSASKSYIEAQYI